MSDAKEAMNMKTDWESWDNEIRLLKAEGAAVYFPREFPDLNRSFAKEVHCVVCMDEGTAHKDVNGEAKFCMAGSGILYPAANEEERVQKVAKLFLDLDVNHLTSHSGCGAVGLAYRRDNPNLNPKEVKVEEIENYAKEWVRKVADEMGRMGHEIEVSHIAASEMERPEKFHNARLVYFDGKGGFNPNIERGLPMGFVVERKYLSAEYVAKELKVAVDIAFGPHGLGELFTDEKPFIIVVFANDETELSALKEEVEKVLEDNEHFKAKRVSIDGLIV